MGNLAHNARGGAAIVRTWLLSTGSPGWWQLAALTGDGDDADPPPVVSSWRAPDCGTARNAAHAWLRGRGHHVERWIAAPGGWIATTTAG